MTPNPKNQKQRYDRQLRLWKEHGQRALEGALVTVVGSDATACEVLKNLILPGVGDFTLVDATPQSESDFGSSFFAVPAPPGTARATAVLKPLLELNDAVRGAAISERLETVLAHDPGLFTGSSAVVVTADAAAASARSVQALAALCWAHGVPFLQTRANGLFAELRIAVPEAPVAEPHDEFALDVRPDRPWPELRRIAAETAAGLAGLDARDHANVPAVLLLACAVAANGGVLQRDAVRKWLGENCRRQDEENFEQAERLLNRLKPYSVPDAVQKVLDDPQCVNLDSSPTPFWLLARAVREFAAAHNGELPLLGVLPDLKADTARYVALQRVYRDKAAADAAEVAEIAARLRPGVAVESDAVRRFCRNVTSLGVIRYRSLADEAAHGAAGARRFLAENSPLVYHVLFRAQDAFFERFGRFPGAGDDTECVADVERLRDKVFEVVEAPDVSASLESLLQEFVRAGNSQLPATAALVGGLAAQEVLKLVTAQYVPAQDLFVFDGVRCVGVSSPL